MPATVAVTSGNDLALLGNAGLLAQARQRVEFAKDRDDGTTLTGLAHHRRRQPAAVGGDAKTLGFQQALMFGN